MTLRGGERRLKAGKAPGPDKIPAEVVKLAAREHPNQILKALNTSLREGKFPREWKIVRVVLIPRKGINRRKNLHHTVRFAFWMRWASY